MAHLKEEYVVIKASKLFKKETDDVLVSDEIKAQLEEVAQELIGSGTIVEIEDVNDNE